MLLHPLQEFATEEASNLYFGPEISPDHWPQCSRCLHWAQDTITQDPPQPAPPIVNAILFTIHSSLLARYVKTAFLYREEQAQLIRCLNLTHT